MLLILAEANAFNTSGAYTAGPIWGAVAGDRPHYILR